MRNRLVDYDAYFQGLLTYSHLPFYTIQYAPNCNTDENCAQYNWCYIAWWKLQDTIGPALFLRIEQNADEWFDIDNEEIASDVTGDEFFQPFLLHFFGDIDEVIEDGTVDVVSEDGTVTSEFNADRIFLDEDYWDYQPEY